MLSPIPQSLVIESAADKLRTATFLTDILSYGATEQGLSSVPFGMFLFGANYIRMPIHGPLQSVGPSASVILPVTAGCPPI